MVWWLYLKYPFLPLQKDLAQSWPLEPSGKRGTPLLTNNIWKIKVTEKSQSLKTICNTWYENLVEESLSEKKVSGLPRPIYDLILHYGLVIPISKLIAHIQSYWHIQAV